MNELYYFINVAIDVALGFLAFRLRRSWLVGFLVAKLLLVTALAGKDLEIFGQRRQ